ncbi:fibronectin type III domain-containing protein [Quadrisphaera sp. KR29]|uniref:fibronectin type III domain-containing protein n=1 Tax=Quadrisphaera sp. KR29 TaxID=3461391 RepID=UPI004044DEAF
MAVGAVLAVLITGGPGGPAPRRLDAAPVSFTDPAAPAVAQPAPLDARIALSWTAPAEANIRGYVVAYTPAGGSKVTMAETTALTASISPVTNGTQYTVEVRTVTYNAGLIGIGAQGPYTSQTPATVLVTPTTLPPTGLTATVGDRQAALSWSAPADSTVSSYEVRRDGAPVATVSSPTRTWTDTGLVNGRSYTWTTRAVYSSTGHTSADSAAATAVPHDTVAPAAPTGVTAVRGDGRVTLTWAASPEYDVASYRLLRDGTPVATVTAPTTGYTDTGLVNDRTYQYSVSALDTSGNRSAESAPAVSATPTDLTPPAVPTGLTATRGDGRVVLSWTANGESDLASYRVLRDGAVVATVTAPATGYTDTGLVNDRSYSYALAAVDARGNASAASSPAVSATPTDLTPPAVPMGLAATAGDGQVVLTWTGNTESDLAGYDLVRDGVRVPGAVIGAGATSVTDTGLVNDRTYSYTLGARDTAGNTSAASAPVVATPTDLTPPAVPARPSAVAGDGVVSLSWTPSSEADLASYRVLRDGAVIATVTAPATTYDDGAVTNGTAYAYALVAVDTRGNASAATAPPVSATPRDFTPPAAPTGLVAARGDGRVVLSWTAVTEADLASYRVLRDGAVVATLTAPATTYTDTGLTNDRAYAYRLVAVDAAGNGSPASDPAVTATPTDLTAPAVPADLAAARGDGLVTLTWTANGEADLASYEVHRDGAVVATLPAPATTYTDIALTNDRRYEYSLRAVDTHGNRSAPTATVAATPTDLTAPAAPTALTATPGDGRVELAWAAVTEADLASYRVYRDGALLTTVTAPVTGWTDLGLVNGQARGYAVSAVDAHGNESPPTATATATPADTTAPDAPNGLAAVPGDGQVVLTWTLGTEPDVASYRVYRDGTQVAVVAHPTTTYTDTGLVNGGASTYRLVAVDTAGNASAASAPVTATPADTAPPAPPSGVTSAAGDGSVTLGWDAGTEPDLASYRVYRDGVLLAEVAAPATSFTDTSATNGQIHAYEVSAVDADGNESARSTGGTAAPVDSTPPAAPSGLSAAGGDGTVSVSWTPNTEADLAAYRVLRDGAEIAVVPGPTAAYSDSDVVNGRTYAYRLIAVDDRGNSSLPTDPAVSATPTDLTPPAPPTGVSSTPGDEEVVVRWTVGSEGDLAGHRVYRDGQLVASLDAPTDVWTDRGLANGVSYRYEVSAVDAHDNESDRSPGGTATPADTTAPGAPTGVVAVAEDQRVVLEWAAPSDQDVASHRVLRDGSQVATVSAPGTSWADTGLVNGRAYAYTVVAVDAAQNESAPSTAVTATPRDTLAPAAPSAVTAVPGDGRATLRWTAPADTDIASYLVLHSDGRTAATTTAPETSATVTGLVDSIPVVLTVVAVDTSGNRSAASAAVSTTPLASGTPTGGAGQSGALAASRDGRFVVVATSARLEPTDTNSASELYRVDTTGRTPARRIAPLAASATGASDPTNASDVAISDSGTLVVLSTTAALVPSDTNRLADVYRADLSRPAASWQLVSVPPTGAVSASVAGTVLQTGSSVYATSPSVAVSGDGGRVLFYSARADLVAGDTNKAVDVFAKDLGTGAVTRVSTATGGGNLPRTATGPALAMSRDGRYAFFTATSSTGPLVLYRKDLSAGERGAALVVSSTTTNGRTVEVGTYRDTGDVAVSDDGNRVVFVSAAKLLSTTPTASGSTGLAYVKDVVRDRLVALGNGQTGTWEHQVALDGTGRWAAFSTASPQTPGDTNGRTDVLLRDLSTASGDLPSVASLRLVTANASGSAVTGPKGAISPAEYGRVTLPSDGSAVVVTVQPLVTSDTNGLRDLYRKELTGGAVVPLVTR